MAGEPVQAGWALWGKEPGSRIDYSVLACSPEPFSRADFGTIITRFAAGNPDSRTTGAAELPWVTVSWVGVDESLHLGIAITDQTGQVDGVGRPITQISYFCVPYQEMARARLSYLALYDAVSPIKLKTEDGDRIPLRVAETTAAETARRADGLGDRVVGAVAASLLRGPVTIVDAEGTTLRQRLELIDAVASLLPYGYRARLSAASWSDSGTRHRLRLAFASRPRDDAAVVSWRNPGDLPGGDTVAWDYFEHLRQLRSGNADHGKKFSMETVVAHLADRTEPRKFEQPQEAVTILREIDLPDRVLQAARDGSELDPVEVRQVIGSGALSRLPPIDRGDLLIALSRVGSADDWPALSQWLGQVQDVRIIKQVLVSFGRRLLWSEKPDDGVFRQCLAVARDRAVDDEVLAEVVQLPEWTTLPSGGVRLAADSLAEAVLAGSSGGDAYPVTQDELAKSPRSVAEYLAVSAGSGTRARDLLNWLGFLLPVDFVQPFAAALGMSRREITERDLTVLARRDTRCVSALLATGSATRRLDQLLPGFTCWLASLGELSPGERRRWRDCLRGLAAGTPVLRAWLDMALLTVGAPPTALPPSTGQADSEPYITGLAVAWKHLGRQYPHFSGERCAQALASYLQSQPWTARKAQAAAVVDLTGRLVDHDRQHVLAAAVGSDLASTPAAKRWDFAQDWLARAQKDDPQLVRTGLLAALANAQPGTSPEELAGLCLRAYRENIPADDACQRLASAGAIDSAEQAMNVVLTLNQEFMRSGADLDHAATWLRPLTRALVRGRFGENLAPEFRNVMSRRLRLDIRSRTFLLMNLLEGANGDYEVTDEERAELAEFRQAYEYIGKKSRRGTSFWRWTGNAGQPSQEPK